jgi:hypothetical protein
MVTIRLLFSVPAGGQGWSNKSAIGGDNQPNQKLVHSSSAGDFKSVSHYRTFQRKTLTTFLSTKIDDRFPNNQPVHFTLPDNNNNSDNLSNTKRPLTFSYNKAITHN